MPMLKKAILTSLIFLTALCGKADAALDIEIVGGAAQQIPIAVVPFAHPQSENLATIINADLRRS